MDFKLTTPVAFIIFNRPDVTMKVFERIRQAKPTKLFLIADGARDNKIGEFEKVQQCRAIKDMVDWKCKVKTNFADKNMGCKNRVYSGISWVFDNVDEAIILEDDCLPSMSFFRFCQELLEKYRNDTRITVIAGSNHDWVEDFEGSYTFANRLRMWGWASWKRAWKLNDIDMNLWAEVRKKEILKKICLNDLDYVRTTNELQATSEGKIDTWDYQFAFANYLYHGLDIIPRVNMVRNIGFGANATHTFDKFSKEAFYLDDDMEFPLIHPKIFLPQDRISENLEPARTQAEMQEEFDLRNKNFNELIQSKQYSAVINYFKDTLRNSKIFHMQFVYYYAYANLMTEKFSQAVMLAEELLKLNAVQPQSFFVFVNNLLAKNHVDDGFKILDMILEKLPSINNNLRNEIVNLANNNKNILASGKYPHIEKIIGMEV